MKNKRLKLTLMALGLLIIGLLGQEYQTSQQQKAKEKSSIARVGVLQFVTHEALDEIYKGIQQGLKEEGYSGKKLQLDFLNAEGDQSKVQTMSQQLVSKNDQVLIGIATPAAQGLASATDSIPIVMGAVTDPIGAKLVKNLKEPGGNVTGVSDKTPIKAQVDLIKTLTPKVKKIGVLYASSEDNSSSQVASFKKVAEKMGYELVIKSVPSTNEIKTTTEVLLADVDALWIPLDNTIASAFSTVVQSAKTAQKPIFPSVETMVSEGGLASVVLDQYALGVETGKMAAQILKGADVATLSVQVFEEGKPVINEEVAKELGITIPKDLN